MNITKITSMKTGLGITAIAGALTLLTPSNTNGKALETLKQDTFEYIEEQKTNAQDFKTKLKRWAIKSFSEKVALPPAIGSAADSILAFAPNPKVIVKGKEKVVKFVVDVTNNILYHYDEFGNPLMGYRVASGKLNTEDQTDEGLKAVSHVETYPYKNAPVHTKRHKNPKDYGPKCIILDKLDPETGIKSSTGEFIHGNKDASSIGKHVSLGCMRMDNEVIKKLAKLVKRDDLVLVIRRVR